MRLRAGLTLVATSILGIALLNHYFGNDARPLGEQTGQAEVPAGSSSNALAPNAAGQHDSPPNFVPITGGRIRSRAPMDPFPRVPKTRNGQPLENDHFVAESVQEQRWLDRNGYPNTQQWTAYSAASSLALEQAAAHGDEVAEVMLTARQLDHGDPKAAGKLMTAGMNGSSFALSMLASYLAGGRHGNPELGYAVSRVVELRGDWRAAITRDFMFNIPLTPLQKASAEGEAFKTFPYTQLRPPGDSRAHLSP